MATKKPKDISPQRLLKRGSLSLAKYHIAKGNKMNMNMVKSTLNKNSITQIKKVIYV